MNVLARSVAALRPEAADFAQDVMAGLAAAPKRLPA